ncbi:MAG: hypothetical protein LBH84_01125 [Prevotellaceae bacterium]|jgi:uncharacterized membrane protein HdeD (DUF308 family)|nr:hypothetical protein [Prevotellaceae bacterium]
MKTFSGSSTWLLLLACGIVLLALSVATFINAEKVLGLLVCAAGVALCGMGVVMGIVAFLPGHRDERPRLLALTVGNVLLGVLVMYFSHLTLIFVGVALALNGVGAMLKALQQKKEAEEGWLAGVFLGITLFALGLVVVIFYKALQQLVGGTFGLLLLVGGLSLVIVALLSRGGAKRVERHHE